MPQNTFGRLLNLVASLKKATALLGSGSSSEQGNSSDGGTTVEEP